jgi:trehalose 6-phosphate phosphatase
MSDRDRIVAAVEDWLAGGGRLLLMSDYDGTLSPIVRDPAQAWLTGEVRGDLRALADHERIRLAIVSGRDLADLRSRVGVPDAIYAGCHGLEIDGPDVAFSHPGAEAKREALRTISLAMHQRAPAVAGMRVEAKRLGLTVHYREVALDQVPQVELELARAIERTGSGLRVFHGSKVFEVLPHVGWTKGECAVWIQQHIAPASRRPLLTVYVGDDWTDEQAFDALSGRGLTVRVGAGGTPSRAEFRLDDVAAVQGVVRDLAARARALAPR